jgi:2-polyprenyl-3-methyl-5-hydroxy-6-metoxy-1,4-benzoquinol methylase
MDSTTNTHECKCNESNNEEPTWDDLADSWESFEGVKEFSEGAYRLMKENVPIADWSSCSILDVGCGTGYFDRLLADDCDCNKVVAMDPSRNMLDVLEQRIQESDGKNKDKIRVVNGSLDEEMVKKLRGENLSQFNVIVANSVCRFLPKYDEFLGCVESLLAPDGVFIQCDWQQDKEPFVNDHKEGFHRQMISDAYDKVGLEVVYLDDAFTIENIKILGAIGRKRH